MHEAQGLEFLDVRDENGRPARLGYGFVEDGGIVIRQTAEVVHLSQAETARAIGLARTKAAEAREFRS